MSLPKILIIDDEQASVNAIGRALRKEYEIRKAYNGQEALKILDEETFPVIISDQRMPEITGIEFFKESMKYNPNTVRILITGYTDIDAVVEAVNSGKIFHYISKPWEPDDLRIIVRQAFEKYTLVQKNKELILKLEIANRKLKDENKFLHNEVEKQFNFSNIIGESDEIKIILQLLKKIIHTDISILITGDTGTGKELIARAVHFNSHRKEKPFIAVNCAALPETLLESKLFGHKKGAFTGAIKDQKGIFTQAEGGTIFLDEIGDTSQALQKRFLRVLQESEYTPVGSEKSYKTDVRVLTATNKNLMEEIDKGNFRQDLYYRLNVMPVHLPPLRQRNADIEPLSKFFIEKFSLKLGKKILNISPEALNRLQNHQFPGNVRELENIIQRAVVLTENNREISSDMLLLTEDNKSKKTNFITNSGKTLKETVELLEQTLIKETLQKTNGNISKTALQLGTSRVGLHKKLSRYKINAENYK